MERQLSAFRVEALPCMEGTSHESVFVSFFISDAERCAGHCDDKNISGHLDSDLGSSEQIQQFHRRVPSSERIVLRFALRVGSEMGAGRSGADVTFLKTKPIIFQRHHLQGAPLDTVVITVCLSGVFTGWEPSIVGNLIRRYPLLSYVVIAYAGPWRSECKLLSRAERR